MNTLKFSMACLAISVLATTGFAMQAAGDAERAATEAADVQPTLESDAAAEPVAIDSAVVDPEAVASESTEAVAEDVAEDLAEEAVEEAGEESEEVSIMDLPLDGSSIETFTAGLEAVDKNATEEEYRNVMSALDFLLFYDVAARRDKARLYSRLNGKTPNQIIERVVETQNRSGR